MKKIITLFVLFVSFTIIFTKQTLAIYDPLSVLNNKIGIHILTPDELTQSKELVDTNGGDWGYITIPVQAGDRDLVKWQAFMDKCRALHLIPIIRLATQGDYFNTSVWKKPTNIDVIDFANFLNSLTWPTKNRYVIIFNEVNRADEWGGAADPSDYAQVLSYAVTVFKSKNQDFYIISAGLDNAAATGNKNYNEYDYFTLMNQAVPGIFNQIDGLSSHSYPNPGFLGSPDADSAESVKSFSYEQARIEEMSNKQPPVFITETGWDQSKLGDAAVALNFKKALEGAWNDPNIVAITPFLLKAGPGPFMKFSFLKENGDKNAVFNMYSSIRKTSGKPQFSVTKKVLGDSTPDNLPVEDFSNEKERKIKPLKTFVKWLMISNSL